MREKSFITPKRIKVVVGWFILFSIATIIYVAAVNISRIGKIAVEIKYAPFEASVFIDDQNYAINNAINYLDLGQHHIRVVLTGFKTIDENIEITKDTKYLYGLLEALDENDSTAYQKHQNDYLAVESIDGKESILEKQEVEKKWPILSHLPYIRNNISIGSMFDDQNDLIITVHAEPTQIDTAINKLKSFNATPSEYNIKIIDFDNKLENKFSKNNNSDPILFLNKGYQNLDIPYQVNVGQQSDNYYYTTISVGKYAGYIPVTYRVVLQKTSESWDLINTPYPVLTVYNTQKIDSSILNSVNQLKAPASIQSDGDDGDGH